MRLSFLEWTMRVAMLVLAGLVTLSILGSIAAISTEADPGGFIVERAAPPAQEPEEVSRPVPAEPVPAPEANSASPADGASAPTAVTAQQPERPERWLEAIAYALLAIAGLLALAILFLWRASREMGRIADALEVRRQM